MNKLVFVKVLTQRNWCTLDLTIFRNTSALANADGAIEILSSKFYAEDIFGHTAYPHARQIKNLSGFDGVTVRLPNPTPYLWKTEKGDFFNYTLRPCCLCFT